MGSVLHGYCTLVVAGAVKGLSARKSLPIHRNQDRGFIQGDGRLWNVIVDSTLSPEILPLSFVLDDKVSVHAKEICLEGSL